MTDEMVWGSPRERLAEARQVLANVEAAGPAVYNGRGGASRYDTLHAACVEEVARAEKAVEDSARNESIVLPNIEAAVERMDANSHLAVRKDVAEKLLAARGLLAEAIRLMKE